MLSGFLQLGASAINYMSGAHANETNIGLAQRQNQYNVEQWMRENQYNLPQNQVERLKAAGINPALAYANGSMMNESAASPQMTAGRVQAPYLSPVDLSQIRLNEALAGKADAEGDKARSDIGVNDAKINEINSTIKNIDAKTEALGYENNLAAATLGQRITAAASKAEAENAKSKLTKKESEEAMQYVERTLKAQWEQLDYSAKEARNRKLISDEQYKEAQELVKQAQAKTSMLQYQDKMKEWTYWLDVADTALSHVENILILFNKLKIPITPPSAPSDKTTSVPGSHGAADDGDVPEVFM